VEFEEYKIMYEAEDTHWWYRGLRGAIFTMLRLGKARKRNPAILDAGCGTGGVLVALSEAGFTNAEGFDFSETAIRFCKERGLVNVRQGSLVDIPFEGEMFDIAISCDVLNDAGIPDEGLALRELYRVLKPGGRLFLNLPALRLLSSEHDRATSIVRRYTRRDISEKLEVAGFRIRRATYRNMLLFPMILAVRLLRREKPQDLDKPARSDIVVPPAPINAALSLIVGIERLLLSRINLPVGSSVSIVAVKPYVR
jgi:SAM-dependent methyltransferase